MKRISTMIISMALSVAVAFSWVSTVAASEISMPALSVKSGATVEVPIKIDQADNLAGVKLVLKYNPDILTFKRAVRSEQAASLMHIVNDKKPGILILVMAGATGINGVDFSIMSLFFETKKDLKTNHVAEINITECQLMSDTLKKLDCSLKVHPLTVVPEGPK